ncbi:hypothetical protein GCM10010307_07710 [Streptomyces vastus]|uniref:Uncharacterized protein n=1 Tax=Streptomyces vastus TaxID=285451 RepID=A0ABN3QCI4_9ACTN
MEAVVGGECGVGVVGGDGLFEVTVGLAHVLKVLPGHDRHSCLDGQLVEGAQDGEGFLDVTAVESGDAGVDAGFGFDQADVGEPGERLAHWGAAEAEALGEFTALPGDKEVPR